MSTEEKVIEVTSNKQIALSDADYTEKGYVRLPYKEIEFKEFITGLLGEPQSLDGRIFGKFVISITELENLYHLICQRIDSQNKGQLIQFIAKIAYDKDSIVTLNSLNNLVSYNEIKPVVPVAVHLSWTYLIQFPDKDYPEKQQISISFISQKSYHRYTIADVLFRAMGGETIKGGAVDYKIEHTSRSWGVDIENILVNQINTLIENPKKITQFMMKHRIAVASISSLSISTWLCSIGYKYIKFLQHIELSNIEEELNKIGLNLNDKLNYLINYIAINSLSKNSDRIYLLILAGFFLFNIIFIWTSISLDINKESYILLTEECKKYKKSQDNKARKKWNIFIGTLITGALTGVIGNFIYAYLISK